MAEYLTNGGETVNSVSLCAPAANLSCFGCCPPIRPAAYDHLDHVRSLRREFRDNRSRYLKEGPRYRPIVGFSCWALGYLDGRSQTIGCLLHPYQNRGEDLRHLIHYGNKCRREQCGPAREFGLLPPEGQRFWLPLVKGMSAFCFSSPKANPLFHLMLWGKAVLETMRALSESNGWCVTELLWRESFLMDDTWAPKAHRYLFRLLLETNRTPGYGSLDLPGRCRRLLESFLRIPRARSWCREPEDDGLPFVHALGLDPEFQDLLRLGLGWKRCSPEAAERIHRALLGLVIS
ncbi:MAG: hypothetical protein AB9873_17355 [Syntrophobacteraceae bacterium]